MQQTREFEVGAFQYTIWLDWPGDKCRIAKLGCTSGSGGNSLNPTFGYGERMAVDLGWDSEEFETAEDAEEFVRRQHAASRV